MKTNWHPLPQHGFCIPAFERITCIFKKRLKIVWQFETLALSLIYPFIILPIFLISIWHSFLSLAPSFPRCHPSSWRQPCSLSHPSVSIHQDRIRFSALLTPFHIGLHNVIKQGLGMIPELQLAPSSSIYFNSASFVLIGWRQNCATLLRYYELSSYNVPISYKWHTF